MHLLALRGTFILTSLCHCFLFSSAQTSHSNPLMLLVNSLCPEVLGQNMLKLGIVLMLISSPLTLAEHLRTCVHVAVVDLPAPSSGCAGPLIQAILAVAPMAARISFDNSRQKGPEDPLRLALSKDTNAPRTIQAAGQNPLALVNEGVLVVDGQ
jgi:DNA replicative helicase MCM subunit Mcm2 (Cdc46/Mcm family)